MLVENALPLIAAGTLFITFRLKQVYPSDKSKKSNESNAFWIEKDFQGFFEIFAIPHWFHGYAHKRPGINAPAMLMTDRDACSNQRDLMNVCTAAGSYQFPLSNGKG